jgi:hypothetical protein
MRAGSPRRNGKNSSDPFDPREAEVSLDPVDAIEQLAHELGAVDVETVELLFQSRQPGRQLLVCWSLR